MRRLKISQLETFMVYMRTGSVTQASNELNTTQPNASKKLKQIEEVVGFPLFSRTGGKLRPTPEAEMLYEHVVRLMQQYDIIESFGLQSSPLRMMTIRVATLATFGSALLPMAVSSFRLSHPDVTVVVDVLDTEKVHAFVSQGLYDFGFVHYPQDEPDLATRSLAQSSIVCLVPHVHPLAGHNVIDATDLGGELVVTYPTTVQFGAVIAKTFADHGVRIRQIMQANHSHVVRRFVEHSGIIGIVDRYSVCDSASFEKFVVKPFRPTITIGLGLIIPQRRPLSRIAQDFVTYVADIASSFSESLERPTTREHAKYS